MAVTEDMVVTELVMELTAQATELMVVTLLDTELAMAAPTEMVMEVATEPITVELTEPITVALTALIKGTTTIIQITKAITKSAAKRDPDRLPLELEDTPARLPMPTVVLLELVMPLDTVG